MKRGGHREKFRHMVSLRAICKHRDTMERDLKGLQPMYRSREEIEQSWIDKGGKPDSQDWFRKGGATGVLSVPNTPQEVLKERVEKVVIVVQGPRDQVLKVVEKPGMSVKNSLCKNNPIPREHYLRKACLLRDQGCREGCQKESVGYAARCKRCWDKAGGEGERVYLGESSRSVYTRAQGHYTDLKSKMKSGRGTSWMADHIQEAHNGVWTEAAPWEDWEFSLNGTHRKPLNRQISEFSAIRRAKTQGVALFNGKKLK